MTSLRSVESLVVAIEKSGFAFPPGPVRVDGYGDSAALSAELLALIRSGRKRAGTGLLWAYEVDGDSMARTGDIEIVIDHLQRPALVTRIVRSEILPFDQVDAEYAAIEGEGDGSLEYWRRAHWAFFSRECRRIEREPELTMPVICSVFELLKVIDAKPASGSR